MIRTQSYRYRVYFTDRPCRDVYASTEEGAKRTAIYAERLVGLKAKRLIVTKAERICAVGYNSPPELFPPVG